MKTLSVVSLIKLTERVKKKKTKGKKKASQIKFYAYYLFLFLSGLICFLFSCKENVYTLKFKKGKRKG